MSVDDETEDGDSSRADAESSARSRGGQRRRTRHKRPRGGSSRSDEARSSAATGRSILSGRSGRSGRVARGKRGGSDVDEGRGDFGNDQVDNNDFVASSSADRDDSVGHFEGGPGVVVADRYRIVRDVGLGTFGRVVECLDLRVGGGGGRGGASGSGGRGWRRSIGSDRGWDRSPRSRRGSFDDGSGAYPTVAIKIVRNVRRYHESALIEADIVEEVNRQPDGRGRSLCSVLLDRFEIPGGHYCLAFECLGKSLYDFLKGHDYRPFPLYCVRDFARQLLEALDFFHSFGLIHTDLKPENILLTSNEEVPYRNWDGSTQMVPRSTRIKVIDFGGATFDTEKKSSVINTRQYRAPEVILGLGWSTPSDLWSAGCIVAELYLGELLFATHDNAEHLALMERAVGPFPRDMLRRATANADVFDSYGWHRMGGGTLSSSSLGHVRKMGPLEGLVTERDRPSGLVGLLRALLTIDPERRAVAREALSSPFCSQIG